MSFRKLSVESRVRLKSPNVPPMELMLSEETDVKESEFWIVRSPVIDCGPSNWRFPLKAEETIIDPEIVWHDSSAEASSWELIVIACDPSGGEHCPVHDF